MSLELSDQQSKELQEFVQAIPQEALEEVYQEASKEEGDEMKETIQKSFKNDQHLSLSHLICDADFFIS